MRLMFFVYKFIFVQATDVLLDYDWVDVIDFAFADFCSFYMLNFLFIQ